MTLNESFCEAVAEEAAKYKNIFQFSKVVGIKDITIKRWINRERSPSLDTIEPILPFINWPKYPESQQEFVRKINALEHELAEAKKALEDANLKIAGLEAVNDSLTKIIDRAMAGKVS